MKKAIIYIFAVTIFITNVYAEEAWFIVTPNVDNKGELVDSRKYNDVKGVEVKFKLLEIVKEIVS